MLNFLTNIVTRKDLLNNTFENKYRTNRSFGERKSIVPLANRSYQLLLTIPITVTKDERTFSRLKIAKTPFRTTMGVVIKRSNLGQLRKKFKIFLQQPIFLYSSIFQHFGNFFIPGTTPQNKK